MSSTPTRDNSLDSVQPFGESHALTKPQPRFDRRDVAYLALLTGFAALLAVLASSLGTPREDAAILFRYADNLAGGHGIVWNIGEAPVDGATDMLFMLALAAMKSIGIPTETGAQILNSISYIATALAVYVFARRRSNSRNISLLLGGVIVLSTAPLFIEAGFAAPTMGLAVLCIAVCTVRTLERRRHSGWLLGAAIAVAGLVRPEGFLYGGCVLVAIIVALRRDAIRPVLEAAVIAGSVGVGFIAWRWSYFGYPLPNPYYRKGGGQLHVSGIRSAAKFAVTQWGFVAYVVVLLLGLTIREVRRWSASFIVALALSLGLWVLLSDEMNYDNRFQYPIMGMAAIFAASVAPTVWSQLLQPRLVDWKRPLVAVVVGVIVLALAIGVRSIWVSNAVDDGRVRVARVLADHDAPGRTIATTEAGQVCWSTGWKCIDTWGLNDSDIAHNGFLGVDELSALSPDVVLLHAPTSPLVDDSRAAEGQFLEGWAKMSDPMIEFVNSGNYTLAGTFGRGQDQCYAVFVREDAADAPAIIEDLSVALDEGSSQYPRGKKLPSPS